MDLSVAGEFDCASAPVVAAHLNKAIAGANGLICIDLGDVTFMDCSGVHALLAARHVAPTRLRLGRLHPAVRRVLELTAALDAFALADQLTSRSAHSRPRSVTMTDLPQEFGISIVQIDGHTKVRVTGELDLATATELRQRLDSVIAEGTGDIDLDLSDVTFLDSSGLVALLAARRRLHDKQHGLRVRDPSKPVLRGFELSGVLDMMMDGRQRQLEAVSQRGSPSRCKGWPTS